jgi:hypothetical protein
LQVNIGNSTAAGTLGSWLDSANIKLTTIYAATYQKSTTNPKQFISQAANQGPCKDVLVRTGDDNDLGSPITVYDQESIANATDPITYVKRISPIDSSCGLAGSVSGYVSNTNQAETAVAGSGLNSDTTTVPPSCNSSGSGVLNWLFCAVIDAVDNTISSVNGIVDNMLSLDASSIASNDKLYLLWSYFRNISSLLLVVIALVMIIAQSMGNS